jgi:hypothetical protein
VVLAVALHLASAILLLLWPLWPAEGVSSANNVEQFRDSVLACNIFSL